MTNNRNKILSAFAVLLIVVSVSPMIGFHNPVSDLDISQQKFILGDVPSNQIPLRRVSFVAPDSNSYIDEFSYMAAVPTSIFYHNDTQYISPLIYSEGSQSEEWLLEDWASYIETDGGITQAFAVGDFSESYINTLQQNLGVKVYPRISGSNAADVAAIIAASEWSSSNTAIIALLSENFNTPSTITGSATHSFQNQASESNQFSGSVTSGSSSNISFTPPAWAGWIEGAFNWTGSEILTHELIDPNNDVVDYSIYNQVYFSRLPIYVQSPVPLQFWLPKIVDGEWIMNVSRGSIPAGTSNLNCEVISHPGYTRTLSVPENAKLLSVTLNWDNAATDLNLALVDPTGRLAMWAPAGSILSNPGTESIELPYPMSGDWTIIAAWLDATTEQNNIEVSWEISLLPTDLSRYMESAANAAVIASLLNAPLLYAYADQVPTETQWALTRLGVTDTWLVDPTMLQESAVLTELGASTTVKNLNSYSSMTSNITLLSESRDIVVTTPVGEGNEFFAPAAYSAAVHGSPVFSLCGDDNAITTRAQETWAPYLIGPEINNIYVINKYENRAENGWYDERIPNKYSMLESVDSFESFLSIRGAYNASTTQPVVIIAPDSLLPLSFDRSLQSHFSPGRIPATTAMMASVLINRGLLHRFLFLTADSADTTLVSMYAYTNGDSRVDNNWNPYILYQIENTTDALEFAGFSIEMHVGQNEVFDTIDSQVALWTLSTHGTLTVLPRDPPSRPGGPGYFSLRAADAPWGFESSESVRDADSDELVNPVVSPAEEANHVIRSTDELEAAIGNIGSPIVILTACLLGGTGMPLMLMEHGAVGVTAAPRTVYFQPAGILSVLLAQSLCDGDTIGDALAEGLSLVSSDYSDPLPDREPLDYANQQILFGDPSVRLYEPSANPHLAAEDPLSESFDNHVPGRGTHGIVALGASNYLPNSLDSLGLDYDYYEDSNYTSFTQLLSIRKVVLVEPDTLSSLGSSFTSSHNEIITFIQNGGVFVFFGVTEQLLWLPWEVTYSSVGSGSTITITDSSHPLLNTPNTLSSSVNYLGHFSSVSANLSVLATDGTNPVIVAGAVGSGKVALTTTAPTGLVQNATIENAVSWSEAPSILLSEISLNQQIIWAGDTVVIDVTLRDLVGNNITDATVTVWVNSSQLDLTQTGSGMFRATLTGEWTASNIGDFDFRIVASKPGYDTLSLTLEQYILVRPFPWLTITLFGGVVVALVGGWLYLKKRRGDDMPWERGKSPRERKMSKEERKKREKEDGKADVKEFFGV